MSLRDFGPRKEGPLCARNAPMESMFKQKLLGLRGPPEARTFSEALFGAPSWVEKKAVPKKIPAIKTESFSEKTQVIESLERFAHDKAKELNTKVLKVEGGEVHVQNPAVWDDISKFSDISALKGTFKIHPHLLEIAFKDKVPGKVKAIFVSEKYRLFEESKGELKGAFIDELIIGFPLKTAELFERMIVAMKLDPSEVIILPVEADEVDLSQEIMEVAFFFNPEVVITLGARATQKILKSNDRLSLVHGQFFNRKLGEDRNLQVVPLFHPSIIETNQNMKKTAWADMQKIMKHLKKLP